MSHVKQVALVALVALIAGCAGPTQVKKSVYGVVGSAQRGDIAGVKRGLADGVEPDALTRARQTPLLAAIAKQQVEVAAALLEAGATADGPAAQRRTPICEAASTGNLAMINLLIGAGAKLDLVCKHNGWTPLTIAFVHEHSDAAARLLAAGASTEFPNRWGKTPLDSSVSRGSSWQVAMLVDAGVDLRGHSWRTLLPVSGNAFTLYKRFKELLPAGRSPTEPELQRIAAQLYREISERFRHTYADKTQLVNALVRAGLDPNTPDPNGQTALEIAWRRHLPDAAMLLLFHHARDAQTQLGAITAEMSQVMTSHQRLLKALWRDPFIGPRMRLGKDGRLTFATTRSEMINLTMFFVVSRSVHTAMLTRFIEIRRDFERAREESR